MKKVATARVPYVKPRSRRELESCLYLLRSPLAAGCFSPEVADIR